MADKTVYVQPVGDDRDDHYHTLALAIAGEVVDNADLTAAGMDGILHIIIRGDWSGGADTSNCTIAGFTTDATHYVNIYTEVASARHKGIPSTSYYRILSASGGNAISITTTNYVKLAGLQVTGGGALGYGISMSGSAAANKEYTISHCLCKGTGDNRDGIIVNCYGGTETIYIYNTICYESVAAGINIGDGNVIKVYNCTLVANGTYGINNTGGLAAAGCIYRNCLFQGNTTNDVLGNRTTTYCATDATAAATGLSKGVGDHTDHTFSFVNAAGDDWHLKSDDTGAIGLGTDAVDSLYTDDIDGVARGATWDIGADQYVAAGGGTVPKAFMHYAKLRSS